MNLIIVTLKAQGFVMDFELPGNIKLKELNSRLLPILKRMNEGLFYDYSGIILEYNGAGLLDRNASLFDYGICTGCILNVVKEEKYNDMLF